jgi:DNA-binding NarL/FixJ family response regulator
MLTPAQQAAADPLPHKERHLLTLIVEGHSNEAMAYHASVSERTVDSHVPMSPRYACR